MNCKNCNAHIPIDSRFCTECGAVVEDTRGSLVSAPWEQEEPEEILQDPNWKREESKSLPVEENVPKEKEQEKKEKDSFFKGLFGKNKNGEKAEAEISQLEQKNEETTLHEKVAKDTTTETLVNTQQAPTKKEEVKWIPPPNPRKIARRRRLIGILLFIILLGATVTASWFWVQKRLFSDLSTTNTQISSIFYNMENGTLPWLKQDNC